MKKLLYVLVAAAFAISLGCASKKKAGEGEGAGADGRPDGSVATKDMSFDPMGSDSGSIAGLSTIYFDYDSSTLSSEARRILAQNAEWIRTNKDVTMQVEGHCDERGTVEYNMALGERRAKAVKAYLVNLGIDAKRLTTLSWGKEKPVARGDSEDAFSKNRRANFVPVPK